MHKSDELAGTETWNKTLQESFFTLVGKNYAEWIEGATALMQAKYPGNYTVVLSEDYPRGNQLLQLHFDDPKDKMWFRLKYT
jgi:hypothetical protein